MAKATPPSVEELKTHVAIGIFGYPSALHINSRDERDTRGPAHRHRFVSLLAGGHTEPAHFTPGYRAEIDAATAAQHTQHAAICHQEC